MSICNYITQSNYKLIGYSDLTKIKDFSLTEASKATNTVVLVASEAIIAPYSGGGVIVVANGCCRDMNNLPTRVRSYSEGDQPTRFKVKTRVETTYRDSEPSTPQGNSAHELVADIVSGTVKNVYNAVLKKMQDFGQAAKEKSRRVAYATASAAIDASSVTIVGVKNGAHFVGKSLDRVGQNFDQAASFVEQSARTRFESSDKSKPTLKPRPESINLDVLSRS